MPEMSEITKMCCTRVSRRVCIIVCDTLCVQVYFLFTKFVTQELDKHKLRSTLHERC